MVNLPSRNLPSCHVSSRLQSLALEETDRAATAFHDIGVYIVRNEAGEMGYKIKVGGGLGRTPVIGSFIREFLPREDLIAYLEAVLRVI